MTREEAIAVLEESKRQNEVMRDNPSTFWASHQMADGVKNAERRIAALDMALAALRPVSREQVEKVCGEWLNVYNDFSTAECSKCGELFDVSDTNENLKVLFDAFKKYYQFCPSCGAPMTDEAVEMVIERWKEALE